jgi:NAD(P)-dependent dehydrogenase (short-subunit alcohol dehydrogenase family)
MYTASKWGVRGLWRSLLDDAQVSSSPVRSNLIAPYFVATPLIKDHVPLLESMGIKLADIDDVEAAAMRFMCDKSIYGRAAGIWQGGAGCELRWIWVMVLKEVMGLLRWLRGLRVVR